MAKHLISIDKVTTLSQAFSCAVEWESIQRSFPQAAGNMRMRAAWDNDRKIMGTPFGGGGNNSGGAKTCSKCKGTGHHAQVCPNLQASKDKAWGERFSDKSKRVCKDCGGLGHHGKHHRIQQRTATEEVPPLKTVDVPKTPAPKAEVQRNQAED